MRQIKFKYRFDNHAPVLFSLQEIETGKVMNFVYKEGLKIAGRDQFTGLVIKGRQVYKGDLYQYRDGSDSCHFEIVWDKERLAWDYKRIEDGELMYNHYDFGLLEDSEYIGTIHDNPELI